jgi:3-deoxy-manno-octulosonate cytidylyltransferase (CMP-KDO synthetase)
VTVKRVIVIPARYGSTRFPGKALAPMGGKPLVRWVYEVASACRAVAEVLIATDDRRIGKAASDFGATVVMTANDILSGTDRVAAALKGRHGELVVNLQGDEPFVRPDMVDAVFGALEDGTDMATLAAPLSGPHEYGDPNTVKVVRDREGFALYFSRSSIPFMRSTGGAAPLRHVGIYGFSRAFLERFVALPKGRLEEAESLEQLRALENGHRIRVLDTKYDGFGIDTPEDLVRAEQMIGLRQWQPERSIGK